MLNSWKLTFKKGSQLGFSCFGSYFPQLLQFATGVMRYSWFNISSLSLDSLWLFSTICLQPPSVQGMLSTYCLKATSNSFFRIYAWIGISLFVFDRLVRALIYAFNNMKPANFTLHGLSGDVTKVRVTSSRIKKWSPGQHVFLSIPELGFGQSHPATILSIPSSHDNDLVFILRAHRGFTQRLLRSAKSPSTDISQGVREKESASKEDAVQIIKGKHFSLIGGPHGGSHSDFAAFDTVLLIAGSTGVTFTLPILLDIAHRSANQRLPVRRIVFTWVIRTISCTEWITDEVKRATESLLNVGIEIEVRLFVTCELDPAEKSTKRAGCKCRNVEGPCCCSDLGIEKRQAASSTLTTQASDDLDIGSSSPESLRQRQLRMGNSFPFACSTIESGRPQLKPLLWDLLDHAKGETGVAVCGPLGLVSCVRNTVATVSEQRGSNKGTGAEGVYLHAESFAW